MNHLGHTINRICVVAFPLLVCCSETNAQLSLSNGGAETGDTMNWSVSNVAAVKKQDQTVGTVTPYEGNWFFTMASAPAVSAVMWQTNALTPEIARLSLSGVVQTEHLDGYDYGVAVLSALDSEGHTVASTTNGPLTTANSNWTPFQVHLDVPGGASAWRVDLKGIRVFGSYVNVFYDGISLTGTTNSIVITSSWLTASGLYAITWTSASAGFQYTVEGATSLTHTAFAPVLPTNQWPISQTTWTNPPAEADALFLRVKGRN